MTVVAQFKMHIGRLRLMRKEWKQAREIKETLSLRVTTTGGRPALFIPKNVCDLYDIRAGDMVKVQLRALFKEVKPEGSE